MCDHGVKNSVYQVAPLRFISKLVQGLHRRATENNERANVRHCVDEPLKMLFYQEAVVVLRGDVCICEGAFIRTRTLGLGGKRSAVQSRGRKPRKNPP
jgi:hypothetical protein